MTDSQQRRLFIGGGISGVVGTLCYILGIAVPMGNAVLYLCVMAWPILSIVFVFALNRYVARENDGVANHLAFVFACLAFAMVAGMISIQLGVRWGIEEHIGESSPEKQELLKLIRQSVRLVDMGLDVAWDLFIGTSLIFLMVAMWKRSHLGTWWGIPSGTLGVLLIIFNVITFPWPPDTRGLFDIGPFIGVYIIALSGRLLFLGVRMKVSV